LEDIDGEGAAPPPLLVLLVEWNPSPHKHVLLAACGSAAVVLVTGTEGAAYAAATEALFRAGTGPGPMGKAAAAVSWHAARALRKLVPEKTARSPCTRCGEGPWPSWPWATRWCRRGGTALAITF